MAIEPSSIGSNFRQMAAWKESQALAAEIAELTIKLPRDGAANVIGAQLLRAAGSIAANIAEGYGRFSQAAYRSHLSIARGSAFETNPGSICSFDVVIYQKLPVPICWLAVSKSRSLLRHA